MADYRPGRWGGNGLGGKFQDIMWGIVVNDRCSHYTGPKTPQTLVESHWSFILTIIRSIQRKI